MSPIWTQLGSEAHYIPSSPKNKPTKSALDTQWLQSRGFQFPAHCTFSRFCFQNDSTFSNFSLQIAYQTPFSEIFNTHFSVHLQIALNTLKPMRFRPTSASKTHKNPPFSSPNKLKFHNPVLNFPQHEAILCWYEQRGRRDQPEVRRGQGGDRDGIGVQRNCLFQWRSRVCSRRCERSFGHVRWAFGEVAGEGKGGDTEVYGAQDWAIEGWAPTIEWIVWFVTYSKQLGHILIWVHLSWLRMEFSCLQDDN